MDRPQACQLCLNSLLVHGSITYKPDPVRCPCRYPFPKQVLYFMPPTPRVEGECTLSFTGDSFIAEESSQPVYEQDSARIAPNSDVFLTQALPEQSLDGASELVCSDLELQGVPGSVLKFLCCKVNSASCMP